MANFTQFWETIKSKNPAMNADDQRMTISVASFKKAMEQAYDKGDADRKAANDAVNRLKESCGFMGGRSDLDWLMGKK